MGGCVVVCVIYIKACEVCVFVACLLSGMCVLNVCGVCEVAVSCVGCVRGVCVVHVWGVCVRCVRGVYGVRVL